MLATKTQTKTQQQQKTKQKGESFVSIKLVFRFSVKYKGYFLLETFHQRAEAVRRFPVPLEVHSKFSQALPTLLEVAVRKGCFFHGISITIRLFFKYTCII